MLKVLIPIGGSVACAVCHPRRVGCGAGGAGAGRPAQADVEAVRQVGRVRRSWRWRSWPRRAGAGPGGRGWAAGVFRRYRRPRDRRGVRHALPTILGLCTAAVASGQVLLADITAWITGAGQTCWPRSAAAATPRAATPRHTRTPSNDCSPSWRRSSWPMGSAPGWPPAPGSARSARRPPGRAGCRRSRSTARRSAARSAGRDADGQVPYLFAAATHGESVVLAERLIGAKTNEVPEFAPLLRGLAQRVGGVGGACSPWTPRTPCAPTPN